MKTKPHMELLISEVFEKATTQHPFIEMYTDLCVLLNEHFLANPVGGDDPMSFKTLLLNECQASFERNMAPPVGLDKLDEDDRVVAEFKYKNQKIGNIKFIGALLGRKMIASKVFLTIIDQLLEEKHNVDDALESASTLLTIAGPLFDVKDWPQYARLNAHFMQLGAIVAKSACAPRTKCLLKDVLDMRAKGWRDHRLKQVETPTTLKEIHDKAAEADGGVQSERVQRVGSPKDADGGWSEVSKSPRRRRRSLSTPAQSGGHGRQPGVIGFGVRV